MDKQDVRHEIVISNFDVDVRFYLSVDSGSYVPPHWHNSLEMVYMLEGSMVIQYSDNNKQTLHKGEFSLVNSRVIHSVTAFPNKALVLQIPAPFLEKYIPAYDLVEFHVNMKPDSQIETTRLERIKKIFMDMYIVYDIRPDGYLLRFNSLLYELVYTLVHSYSVRLIESEAARKNKPLNKIKEIMQYIELNHTRKLTATEIAGNFGYNPDYMARLFKKHLGMTPVNYLYEIRLIKIVDELQHTDISINDIFEKHGCTNYKHMVQLFKKRYGCTPRAKRLEILETPGYGIKTITK